MFTLSVCHCFTLHSFYFFFYFVFGFQWHWQKNNNKKTTLKPHTYTQHKNTHPLHLTSCITQQLKNTRPLHFAPRPKPTRHCRNFLCVTADHLLTTFRSTRLNPKMTRIDQRWPPDQMQTFYNGPFLSAARRLRARRLEAPRLSHEWRVK